MLLDGQQRLTSLSAVIRGEPVLPRPEKTDRAAVQFNLEHPDVLAVVTEVKEDADGDYDDNDLTDDEADSTDDELMRRFAEWADPGSTCYAIEQHLVKNRIMHRVPDRAEPRSYRLEFWSRQVLARAIRRIKKIEQREAEQVTPAAG